MSNTNAEINKYWQSKFGEKQKIWGNEPSKAAECVAEILSSSDISGRKLLDVACGYGRDSVFFARNNFAVCGIDNSASAIKIGKREGYQNVKLVLGDVFHMPFSDDTFDYVFGNFILHLFQKEDRERLLLECNRVIKPGGLLFFSVASMEDPDFSGTDENGKNYHINERGVLKYYYSRNEIYREFAGFRQVTIHRISEHHTHDTPHNHISYLISAKRRLDLKILMPYNYNARNKWK